MTAVLTFGNDFLIFSVGEDLQGRCPVFQVNIFLPFFIRNGVTMPTPAREAVQCGGT
jgi:hypothetical protein